MDDYFIKLFEMFKPEQTSDLEFKFFISFNEDTDIWLKETSHEYSLEDIDGEIFIAFKEIQGAVEFKLRFV